MSTDIEGKNSWIQCFSVDGVRLPTGYYFGVTAATGDLSGEYLLTCLSLSCDDLVCILNADIIITEIM